jgi:hypothetical protein
MRRAFRWRRISRSSRRGALTCARGLSRFEGKAPARERRPGRRAGFIVEPTFFLHSAARAHTLEIALAGFEWSNASLYVVYPPTRQVSARVRAFADAVIARFNNNPYWDEILRPA